jgi:hypothetical protein
MAEILDLSNLCVTKKRFSIHTLEWFFKCKSLLPVKKQMQFPYHLIFPVRIILESINTAIKKLLNIY